MRHRYFLALIGFVLVLAACGGGDDVSGEATTAAPETTTAPAETTEAPTETTEAPAETTTTAAPETTTTAAPETTTTVAAAAGDDETLAALRQALVESSEATSGRMEGSFTIVGAEGMPTDTELSMPFAGAFDNTAEVFQFIMDMSGFAEAAGEEIPPGFEDLFGEIEVRQFGDVAYMKFPFFSMFLGVETEWIRFPADEAGSPAESFGGVTPSNPADLLSSFEDADATVVELGAEQVRGVDTTHYLVTFDMEKLLENASPEERAEIEAQGLPFDELPMDLWVGDDGLVYRYVLDVDGASVDTEPGEGFERMVMTFELYDYGTDIQVPEPGPGEYTDGEELGGLFEF